MAVTSGGPPREPSARGEAIIRIAWISNVIFVVATVPHALGASLGDVAAVVSFVLFVVSLPIWLYSFGRAVVRSAQGDDISVARLWFLSGSAPKRVRVHLLGATVVAVVVAIAVAASNPAAVLVPMLPLGLAGLWGARHGTYPPRPEKPATGRP